MSGRLLGNIVAFLAMAAWATQFPLLAKLLETWDPVALSIARTLVPGLALLFVALLTGSLRYLRLCHSFDIVLIGGAGLGVATILFVIGQSLTHPVTASVIVSTLPLCSALIGFAAGEEKIGIKLSLAIVLALVGGAVCALAGQDARITFQGGELFILGSVFIFAWYTRASIKRLGDLPPVVQAGITMIPAGYVAYVVFALALPLGLAEIRFDAEPYSLMLLAWVCIASLGLSMALWFWASRELGVTVAGMHHNMVPFYVVVMSLFLDAEILPGHIAGAALVVAGAVLAQLPDFRRQRAVPPLPQEAWD